ARLDLRSRTCSRWMPTWRTMPSSKASARTKAPKKKAPPRSPGAEASKVELEAPQGESASVGDLVAALGGSSSEPSHSEELPHNRDGSPREEAFVTSDGDPAQASDPPREPHSDADAIESPAAEAEASPPTASA